MMLRSKAKKQYADYHESLGRMNASIVEYVRGIQVVKVFSRSMDSFVRLKRDIEDFRDFTVVMSKKFALTYTGFLTVLSSTIFFLIPPAVILLIGAPSYSQFIPTVFLFLIVGGGIFFPLLKLLHMSAYLNQNTLGVELIDDILNKQEIPEPSHPRKPESALVEFRDVTFGYTGTPVLKNISFKAMPGTVTALVGPSGAGKTTIGMLTARFWDVVSGEILVGGVPIKSIRTDELMRQISFVFQDNTLFFDTIEENIRMGNSSAGFAEVMQAAVWAQCHEFIKKLEKGYKTLVGEGGTYLSGGEQLLSHQLPQMLGALVAPTALLACLAFISWKLALAAALVIPLAWPMAWLSFKIIVHFGKKHQKYKVESSSRMIEYIQGIQSIKAFNLSGTRFDRLEKAFRRLKDQSIRLEAGSGPTVILSGLVLNGGFTLIILLGFTLLLSNEVSLPVYIMFLILGARIYEPLLHALIFMAELNYFKLGVERIANLRKTEPLAEGDPNERLETHDIVLKNVSFGYHDAEVLKNVNLTIPEKALTALVGPSGSGKTTLTRLIARFWDVGSGEIRIGGKNIKAYTTDNLLADISIVFQDVYLFNDSIFNNIRIGRPGATREEIIAAAKSARCHDFIEALADGYETVVGEGGSTLSGGEKQRISIARAILKDAPIVLLDEATAALDPENELHIQEAIDELVKDKTVVVIAHRLNTVLRADKIVVIDKGCIVEEGTHDFLLSREGLYKALWDEQQRVKGWKFGQEREWDN
jgi:ATP-binding cassette, subfamily B, bacterial IrtB/YbtQ